MEPTFFKTPADMRKWLQKNHDKETEILVGFYKVSSGKPSITWSESVDQALCFGWIDGVRKGIDDESYTIRFTPRKASSIWSAINIKKMADLTEQGLMQPAGLATFEKRTESKSRVYSFEQKEVKFDAASLKTFKANKQAWGFFLTQPKSYVTPATWWVVNAKQEVTKAKRLQQLIEDSEAGKRLKHLSYNKAKK